jgi:hypothetical protein
LREALLAPLVLVSVACGRLLGFGDDDEPPPAAPVSDAGGTADVVAVEGGAAGNCDGFLFCDDFERADLLGPWDQIESYGDAGIVLSIDPARAASPSRSLRVDVSGAAEGGATLVRSIPPATRRFEIEFSLLIDEVVGDNVHPVSLAFNDSTWAFFIVDTGGISLVEQIADRDAGTKPYRAQFVGPPTYGAFERMTFVVDLDAARIEMRRASGAITTLSLELGHGNMRQIAVGADFAFASPSRHWIDDVAMRWR